MQRGRGLDFSPAGLELSTLTAEAGRFDNTVLCQMCFVMKEKEDSKNELPQRQRSTRRSKNPYESTGQTNVRGGQDELVRGGKVGRAISYKGQKRSIAKDPKIDMLPKGSVKERSLSS
jgi:hypothetical protein